MPQSTDSLRTKTPGSADDGPQWVLSIALDCQRLDAPPSRHALAGIAVIEIGRGDQRAVRHTGDRLRVDLDDRGASQVHLRIERAGDGWVASDAGSKNGTRINGRAFDRGPVHSGDVIECGGTFFVLRCDPGPLVERDADDGLATRTLSPSLERELAPLAKIARSRVPVFVRGETGTGKEVVATAIHEQSRRTGPLVTVNCGAIPPTLLESELFGSRKGAFSGAEDRPGLIRNADGGTLFLDEIAELPASSQAALLRFLQEGEVIALGAGKPTVVNVRVVAATNRTVETLVGDGSFRRDLYARLRGYEVRLPPLRDRIEDLGLLIAALIARHAPDGPPRRLSRGAARALFLHAWPFNIRELEQALRTALAISSGPELRLADLRLAPALPADGDGAPGVLASDPSPAADASTREQLLALLEQHDGNLSAVARALATSRSQVHRLLTRHAIDPTTLKRR